MLSRNLSISLRGYFLDESSYPLWFRWLKIISFVSLTVKSLADNEFRGARFNCKGAQDGV